MSGPYEDWAREIVHRGSFPERLDDEFSFLSILRTDPSERWLQDPRLPKTLDVRITFRRAEARPSGFFSRKRPTVDFRIEMHGVAREIGLADKLQLSGTVGQEVIAAATEACLQPGNKLRFADDHESAPDPGDLPGVWVIDGNIETQVANPLAQASNHALMSLSTRADIELLRLP